ncbi:hypothetical protein L1049_008237 [Liquidambar formosana]|uniref:Cytochrome P450 n=1 Tax=Liquidambar formosana TaxID=63359 RepID=A0AAP0S392_LIQFO
MEFTWSSLAWSIFVLSATLFLLQNRRKSTGSTKRRPPGPPGWPVFGNMFDLGTTPHQTLYRLYPKYGPVLWLQLGTIKTMVIQSPKAAAELFKNHDLAFSDRKCPDALTALNYYQGSMAIGRYGAYWRVIRRVCSTELLVNKRINEMAPLRRKWVDNMIRWIEEDATAACARGESGVVNIPHFLFLMAFNLVGNIMLSRDLLELKSKEGPEFFDAMDKFIKWVSKPNVVDFFPFLKWLDPQGIGKNMERDMGRAMSIVSRYVKERVQERQFGKEKGKDFLDVLLEYEGDGKEGPDKISDENIIIIILEMFFARSETTSSTIEWSMAELLRSPEAMRKAKEELDQVVGPNRKVEESDMDKLPYLRAVVKETLRLHPAAPLLLPRNAIEDTNFMGYLIPKNTQVLVNAWAIGRDPDSWQDPLSFKPESNVNVTPETLDMNERVGITLRKLFSTT